MIQKNIISGVSPLFFIDITPRNPDVNSVMTSTESLVILNMLESIGPVTVRRLLETFTDPERILQASKAALRQVPGIGEEIAHSITTWEQTIDLASQYEEYPLRANIVDSTIDMRWIN